MERRIYGPELIPKAWQPDMRTFTEPEFVSKVTIDGHVRHTTSDTITASCNHDRYNPVGGELVKAADDPRGVHARDLTLHTDISNAQWETTVQEKKRLCRGKTISGINFGEAYKEFY